MRKLSTALLAGALLTLAIPASAQSLGELAKKEAERRKAAAPASKTYTNADLKQVPTPSGTAKEGSEAIKADAKADDAAKPSDKAEPEKVDSTKPPEPAKDEAYWKGRITSAREDVRRNEAFKEALQTRVNALSADFANRDDPYQRAKIADDRQKALAEMARLTQDIDKGNKLIAEIEEEARRAGVPPGWIR
jgi:hypothetical protein